MSPIYCSSSMNRRKQQKSEAIMCLLALKHVMHFSTFFLPSSFLLCCSPPIPPWMCNMDFFPLLTRPLETMDSSEAFSFFLWPTRSLDYAVFYVKYAIVHYVVWPSNIFFFFAVFLSRVFRGFLFFPWVIVARSPRKQGTSSFTTYVLPYQTFQNIRASKSVDLRSEETWIDGFLGL